MKPVIATSLRLASSGLLLAALAGCGVENALGPVADAQTPSAPIARIEAPVEQVTIVTPMVVDPGSPDDDAAVSGSPTGPRVVSGNGKDKPQKVQRPKHRRH